MFRRQVHWLFVVVAIAALLIESLAWSAAVLLPGVGQPLRRSISHEAPLATAYVAVGDALRPITPLRDYGNAYAADALEPLQDRIKATPELATEIVFGPTASSRHGMLKWLYYVPLVAGLLALVLFLARPTKIALIPRRH